MQHVVRQRWYGVAFCVLLAVVVLGPLLIAFPSWGSFSDSRLSPWESGGSSRRLLSLPNCTPAAITQFPGGLFSQEQRKEGAVVIHVVIALYMFLGFALICDDYFVPSLEVMCDVLGLTPDVAGATFMAAGSSAPELATAVIAVFIAKDDIGIGTVVGSAVYNVMFVISICALFAGMVIHLNWWPLFRDCLFYALSVLALAVVILDEKVYWYEAVAFIVLYALYILLMYFNTKLETWIVPKFSCCDSRGATSNSESAVLFSSSCENGVIKQKVYAANGNEPNRILDNSEETRVPLDSSNSEESDDGEATTKLLNKDKKEQKDLSDVNEPESALAPPSSWLARALWCMALPLKLLFFISVPDCRFPRWRRWFPVTFVMCLVWLSAMSYLMVWMITVIGFTAGIADTIMGLTFVAFGVSLPDVIASVIVVREGLGDMAVSNAVGSNVFDILICLGVPWVIQTAKSAGEPVQVYSEGMLYSTFTLLGTVIFLLVATHINRWRLTKTYGVVLMFVYVFFVALSSLYELNLFGYFHPPQCPVDL